jgi:hypothetical protein
LICPTWGCLVFGQVAINLGRDSDVPYAQVIGENAAKSNLHNHSGLIRVQQSVRHQSCAHETYRYACGNCRQRGAHKLKTRDFEVQDTRFIFDRSRVPGNYFIYVR